ncbi:MAG: PfkB family carbohydrate kinase [Pseudomonadota bacterium]
MTTRDDIDIICIGSVLWDVIGRTSLPLGLGNDKPGYITRVPGGVALIVAMTLRRLGLRPALISAVGTDPEGCTLEAACAEMGLITQYLLRDPELPTDQYMAIESQGNLVAAIADAHSLEAAGAGILAPLRDGRLGSDARPWTGLVAIDGNLTGDLLAEIAADPAFGAADLRLAPASPGKVRRLLPLLAHPRATLYVNCEEAGLLTETEPATAIEGAEALLAAGALRVLVTQGSGLAVEASAAGMVTRRPPQVAPIRITGAGDTFMAAHIAAELRGLTGADAVEAGLSAAAAYVAG